MSQLSGFVPQLQKQLVHRQYWFIKGFKKISASKSPLPRLVLKNKISNKQSQRYAVLLLFNISLCIIVFCFHSFEQKPVSRLNLPQLKLNIDDFFFFFIFYLLAIKLRIEFNGHKSPRQSVISCPALTVASMAFFFFLINGPLRIHQNAREEKEGEQSDCIRLHADFNLSNNLVWEKVGSFPNRVAGCWFGFVLVTVKKKSLSRFGIISIYIFYRLSVDGLQRQQKSLFPAILSNSSWGSPKAFLGQRGCIVPPVRSECVFTRTNQNL